MAYWWLSFVDPTKPTGQASLGVCVVEVEGEKSDIGDAASVAWTKRCNPGGEIAGWQLDSKPPDWFPLNTLFSRDEIEVMRNNPGGPVRTAGKEEASTSNDPSPP